MTDNRLIDAVAEGLDRALAFDGNVVENPIALLWPDKGRLWEPIASRLQNGRAIVSLGEYDPGQRGGPAYWLRCVIAATIELDEFSSGTTIVYLPGLSRDDLRTLEAAPRDIAPLAALQYRCQWFSQPNGRDWTIRAFFANAERGLGLSVAADDQTTEALAASIGELADLPMARLLRKAHRRRLPEWSPEPRSARRDAQLARRSGGRAKRSGREPLERVRPPVQAGLRTRPSH